MKNTLIQIMQDPEFPEGRAWQRRRFSPNEVIVHEGDQDRTMYLIERGRL